MTTRAARVLNRPISLNGLLLPNRIVMAPMTRAQSPDGVPTEEIAAYFARRAGADVGLVMTEATYVDHPSAGQHGSVSRIFGDAALAGWARVVEAVHGMGGRIAVQLQHVGTARNAGEPPYPDAPPVGPSGIPLDPSAPIGHTMTRHDIHEVVQAFAAAAADAERIGFDGIEIHGAHGYLIDQFLWSDTNRRTDAYGGDIRARTRFAREVVEAVRGSVDRSFPVIVRLSQWKQNDFAARIADSPGNLDTILTELLDAGADAFHASTRRFWEPAFDDSDLNLAGWIKKLTGRPTIGVGSVGLDSDFMTSLAGGDATVSGIDGLLDRMEADEFDMIAVGRSLLADPAWATKILDGRADEVVPFTPAALGVLH